MYMLKNGESHCCICSDCYGLLAPRCAAKLQWGGIRRKILPICRVDTNIETSDGFQLLEMAVHGVGPLCVSTQNLLQKDQQLAHGRIFDLCFGNLCSDPLNTYVL